MNGIDTKPVTCRDGPKVHFAVTVHNLYNSKDWWIQELLKEEMPKLRTDKTLAPVGEDKTLAPVGEVPPTEAEKNVIFKVNSYDLVHFLHEAPTQSRAPYLWKI